MTITLEEALQTQHAWEERLLVAKRELKAAGEHERAARATLAREMTSWANGGKPLTPEENRRQYLARSLEERRRRAEAGQPTRQIRGRSVLDRMGEASMLGDGSDFARKGFQHGHRRGSVPMSTLQSMRARVRAAKVPSDR